MVCELNTDEKLINEINRLKIKCNAQVDKMISLQKSLEALQNKALEKKDFIKNIDDFQENNFNNFIKNMKIIYNVFVDIQKLSIYIPYKNVSKNSLEYYKLEKTIFDAILTNFTNEDDVQELIQFMSDFGLLKTEKSGKYIYCDTQDGMSIKIYLVKKNQVDYVCNLCNLEGDSAD